LPVGIRHDIQNGVLLRSDIHKLYDRGYVTIDPDYNFKVSDRLKDEFNNGKTYYQLDKQKIWLPSDKSDWPSRENLEYHQQMLFME
jgi:putative restriction endonuclease